MLQLCRARKPGAAISVFQSFAFVTQKSDRFPGPMRVDQPSIYQEVTEPAGTVSPTQIAEEPFMLQPAERQGLLRKLREWQRDGD